MELLHLQSKDSTTFLYLCFNRANDKTYGLKSDKVPEEEAKTIKANIPRLKNSDKPYHIQWLKTNTPMSYKTAYRELNLSDFTILDTYSLM